MTDDQTVRQLDHMPNVEAELAAEGASYERFFVNHPLCCPSRATFLTGQYFHNHRVAGTYRKLHDSKTLPVWLRRAGYATGFAGKYLNGYGGDRPRYVPPGWNEWYAAVGGSTQDVYGYRVNEIGNLVRYGGGTDAFKQDVITAKARAFISRRAPRGRPFFLHVAYTAPHRSKGARPQPPDNCGRSSQPAARHANAFDSAPLPQGGSLNEREVSDKPREVRRLPRLHQDDIRSLTRRYRCTVESLQSVDEGVAGIVEDLAVAGELASTILIFTSDNGFFFGEHRIRSGKNRIYEEATRVPLVIRGPGFGRGRESERLAVNADLTRTILDAANADPRLPQDGVSLLRPAGGRKAISIETRQVDAVRTRRYKYASHDNGARELYDLRRDPHELHNKVGASSYRDVRERMQGVLRRVARCAGVSCR